MTSLSCVIPFEVWLIHRFLDNEPEFINNCTQEDDR
jgi:hypothetical protein